MDEIKLNRIPDVYINCPMLKKPIADGWCLDINLGVRGELKKTSVKGEIDWKLAKKMCPNCPVSYFNT